MLKAHATQWIGVGVEDLARRFVVLRRQFSGTGQPPPPPTEKKKVFPQVPQPESLFNPAHSCLS